MSASKRGALSSITITEGTLDLGSSGKRRHKNLFNYNLNYQRLPEYLQNNKASSGLDVAVCILDNHNIDNLFLGPSKEEAQVQTKQ